MKSDSGRERRRKRIVIFLVLNYHAVFIRQVKRAQEEFGQRARLPAGVRGSKTVAEDQV